MKRVAEDANNIKKSQKEGNLYEYNKKSYVGLQRSSPFVLSLVRQCTVLAFNECISMKTKVAFILIFFNIFMDSVTRFFRNLVFFSSFKSVL